jgi:hypothetical protein
VTSDKQRNKKKTILSSINKEDVIASTDNEQQQQQQQQQKLKKDKQKHKKDKHRQHRPDSFSNIKNNDQDIDPPSNRNSNKKKKESSASSQSNDADGENDIDNGNESSSAAENGLFFASFSSCSSRALRLGSISTSNSMPNSPSILPHHQNNDTTQQIDNTSTTTTTTTTTNLKDDEIQPPNDDIKPTTPKTPLLSTSPPPPPILPATHSSLIDNKQQKSTLSQLNNLFDQLKIDNETNKETNSSLPPQKPKPVKLSTTNSSPTPQATSNNNKKWTKTNATLKLGSMIATAATDTIASVASTLSTTTTSNIHSSQQQTNPINDNLLLKVKSNVGENVNRSSHHLFTPKIITQMNSNRRIDANLAAEQQRQIDDILAKAKASPRGPICIRSGPRGYGFTLRAIKVFYGDTNFYTIQHLCIQVDETGPAFAGGLRVNDLVTHVNDEPVCGRMHHEVVQFIMATTNNNSRFINNNFNSNNGILKLNTIQMDSTNIKSDGKKRSQISKQKMIQLNNNQFYNNNSNHFNNPTPLIGNNKFANPLSCGLIPANTAFNAYSPLSSNQSSSPHLQQQQQQQHQFLAPSSALLGK